MRTSTVHATAATAAATVSENRSSSFWRRLTEFPPATHWQGPACRRLVVSGRARGCRSPRRGEDRAAARWCGELVRFARRGRVHLDFVPPQEHSLPRRAAGFPELP